MMQNKLTRRQFTGYLVRGAGAIVVAGDAFMLVACNPTDVWHQIERWTPLAISTFEGIVSLVLPIAAPGIDAIAATVEAGFAAVSAAVDEYLNAPAADKATFAQKLQLALKALADNIQTFLSAINESSNPIVKVAVALITLLVNAIAGFIQKIGLPVTTFRLNYHLGKIKITATPTTMTRKQFIAAVNAQFMEANRPDLQLPQTK